MSQASNYLENKLTDHVLRGTTFTSPATIYVSLHTANPADDATGTEVSGGAYARVAITANTTNWSGTQSAGSTSASSGTGGASSNNGAITFPTPSGGNWGVVTHFGIWDALTTGNLLVFGALGTSKTINDGDAAPAFAAAALVNTIA